VLILLGKFIHNKFMKIKKHKIKVQSQNDFSGFVVDLRSDHKKREVDSRSQMKPSNKIFSSSDKDWLITTTKENEYQGKVLEHQSDSIRDEASFVLNVDKNKTPIKNKVNDQISKNRKKTITSIIKKTFLFPVFLLLFKMVG